MQTVLTIAGFDPSSGAGVTADLKTFAAHGLFGTSCITALTVQSTQGVMAAYPVDSSIIEDTLHCLNADLPPAGMKIGMVGTGHNILRISSYCRIIKVKHRESAIPVVLDPVVRSSSGRELIEADGLAALQEHLLPAVDWITPNLAELAILSGVTVSSREDVPHACRILRQNTERNTYMSPLGIIATGGHLESPDDYMLTPDGEEFWFPGQRVETTFTHGTGCAFSSAFLSRLVLGDTPFAACTAAKAYVLGALQRGIKIGMGTSPINHLWSMYQLKL